MSHHLLHLDATSLAYCLSFLTLSERFRTSRSCRSTLPSASHPVAWQFSMFNVPLMNLPQEKKYHRLIRRLELLDVLPQWRANDEGEDGGDPFALSEFTRLTSLHLGGAFFNYDRRDCYGLLDTENPVVSAGSLLREKDLNHGTYPAPSSSSSSVTGTPIVSSILTLSTEEYNPNQITASLVREYTSMSYILSHKRMENLTSLDYRLELKAGVLKAITKLKHLKHLVIGEVLMNNTQPMSPDSIISSLKHLDSLCITIQLPDRWNPFLPFPRLPGLPPTLRHLDLKIGRGRYTAPSPERSMEELIREKDALMSEAGMKEEEQQERMCILGAVLQQCTHPSFSCSLRKLYYAPGDVTLVDASTIQRAKWKRNMIVQKFVRGELRQFYELRQRTYEDEERDLQQQEEEQKQQQQFLSSYTPPPLASYRFVNGLSHLGPFPLHLLSHGLTNLELEKYAHNHDFITSFTLGMMTGGCRSLTYLSLRPISKEDSLEDKKMFWQGISHHTRLRVLILDFGLMSNMKGLQQWTMTSGTDDVGVEVMIQAGMKELEEVRLLSHRPLWSLATAKMLSVLPQLRSLRLESSGLLTLSCMKQILTSSSLLYLDIIDPSISRALQSQNVGLASLLLQHASHCRSTLSGFSPRTIVAQVKESWFKKTWRQLTG